MKKLFLLFAAAGILAACGGGEKKEEQKDEKKEAEVTEQKTEGGGDELSSNPVYQKGVELIGKNDCLTCHKFDEKLQGPAYRDVAKKYAGMDTAVQFLANKIITGGSGNWGEIPMAPHSSMSIEDAKALAEYILLFKDK
jgi:cytochrome c